MGIRLLDAALGVAERLIGATRDALRERLELAPRPTYRQGYLDALAAIDPGGRHLRAVRDDD